jgi:hypothetical protein
MKLSIGIVSSVVYYGTSLTIITLDIVLINNMKLKDNDAP